MKKNRLLVLLLSFVMAFSVFALAACGDDNGNKDDNKKPDGTTVTLTVANVSVAKGGSETITVTYTGTGTLTYDTGDHDVATVTKDATDQKKATVNGISKGATTLTVTDGTVTKTADITVTDDQVGVTITISPAAIEVAEGEDANVTVTYTGAGKLTYSIPKADLETATVAMDEADQTKATVHGVKAGTTTLTVTDGAVTKTANITVTAKGEEPTVTITITPDKLEMVEGDEEEVEVTYNGEGTLTYSIPETDSGIATVVANDENNKKATVTAVGEGTTTLTVTDGTVSKTCEISVSAKAPDATSGKITIGGEEVTFTDEQGVYQFTEGEGELTVAYEDISGNGYSQMLSSDITSVIGENNILNLTIKNNGEETAKVRIDVNGNAGSVYGNDYPYVNLKAEYTGAAEGDVVGSGNDYIYGGADWVQIKAGGTVTCKITFKTGVGANLLALYIDSSTWNDEGTHTGSVTLSAISFTAEEVVGPDVPDDSWTAIDLSGFAGYNDGGVYSFNASANSIDISHESKPTVSSNINKSMSYGNNNKIHMKIKNNLDSEYKIRINVQNAGWDYRTVIKSATVDGNAIEVPTYGENWDGITVTLAANAEIVLEFIIDPNGAVNLCFGVNNMADGAEVGNVTISEVCMKYEAE
ncbi:MAG: hypothetical protein J1G38_06455 [Clostridiales bacterium]|nr:hypothetical protein [Clostridiales bacterium]